MLYISIEFSNTMTLVDWFLDTIALLLGLLHIWIARHFQHWEEKGVHHVAPQPLVGSMLRLLTFSVSPAVFIQGVHEAAGSHPYIGFYIFGRPALLVRDPSLLQHILVKDFSNFTDRLTSSNKHKDPVGAANLFCIKGNRWRQIRACITHTFSTARLKIMFSRVLNSASVTRDYILERGNQPINVKDLFVRTSLDSMCSTLFGIESSTLYNSEAQFLHYGHKMMRWTPYRALEALAHFFSPELLNVFDTRLFECESTEFLINAFSEAITEREKTGLYCSDLVDSLIQLKKQLIDVSEHEVLGQAMLFFAAGFETTSSAMAFAMYELALHPEIQDRLRTEIQEVTACHGGQVTYEGVKKMSYLDMVVSEVLRKYPPMSFIDRVCLHDYHIPGTDVVIEKGTPIFVSLLGLHRDSIFYPDPEDFNPERFNKEKKSGVHPFSYIPFGDGPRNCIGLRLGLMSVKLVIIMLLQSLRVETHESTPVPLQLSPYVLFLKNLGRLPLMFVPIGEDNVETSLA